MDHVLPTAIEVDGKQYYVTFGYNGPITTAVVTYKTHCGGMGTMTGVATCNPMDAYDRQFGEKLAMRRACNIGEGWGFRLKDVYSAYRKSLRGT